MKVSCFDILKVFGLDLILNIRDNNIPSAGAAGHEKTGLRPGQMERLRRQGKSWLIFVIKCIVLKLVWKGETNYCVSFQKDFTHLSMKYRWVLRYMQC